MSFGYNSAWFAVPDTPTTADQLIRIMGLSCPRAMSCGAGITLALSRQSLVFLLPAIEGWRLLVGECLYGNGTAKGIEWLLRHVSELTRTLPEAQAFGTRRTIEYHFWIKAAAGRVTRAFAYLGESDETLCDRGELTPVELGLGYGARDIIPDEEHVLSISCDWSLDPRTVDCSAFASEGQLFHVATPF